MKINYLNQKDLKLVFKNLMYLKSEFEREFTYIYAHIHTKSKLRH